MSFLQSDAVVLGLAVVLAVMTCRSYIFRFGILNLCIRFQLRTLNREVYSIYKESTFPIPDDNEVTFNYTIVSKYGIITIGLAGDISKNPFSSNLGIAGGVYYTSLGIRNDVKDDELSNLSILDIVTIVEKYNKPIFSDLELFEINEFLRKNSAKILNP